MNLIEYKGSDTVMTLMTATKNDIMMTMEEEKLKKLNLKNRSNLLLSLEYPILSTHSICHPSSASSPLCTVKIQPKHVKFIFIHHSIESFGILLDLSHISPLRYSTLLDLVVQKLVALKLLHGDTEILESFKYSSAILDMFQDEPAQEIALSNDEDLKIALEHCTTPILTMSTCTTYRPCEEHH